MDLLNFVLDPRVRAELDVAAPAARPLPDRRAPALRGAPRRRPRPLPGWAARSSSGTRSRGSALLVPFMVVVASDRAAGLGRTTRPPSTPTRRAGAFWHHLFGTTDQGQDIFSQVVLGARRSLILGAAAAVLATVLADVLGILAAYSGGIVDEIINFFTNIFLVVPTIPLLIVISELPESRGMTTMILVLGLTLWAFEARILRGQALSLKSRDFIQAAKVAGESTWRVVFGELMPNMISRITAAFVLVFYIAMLVDAGLEFLGLGDNTHVSWGMMLYWAQNNSTVLQGEWWPFLFPGLALAITVVGARLPARGHRRAERPEAAPQEEARAPAVRSAAVAGETQHRRTGSTRGRDARRHPRLRRVRLRRRARGRRDLADDRRERDPRPRRRVRLRQEHRREPVMQIFRPPAQIVGGEILFRGEDLARLCPRSCVASAGGTSRWSSRAR